MEVSMNLEQQIDAGKLVCPKSKQRLFISPDNEWLISQNKDVEYKLFNKNVPIMLIDPEWARQYANESSKMSDDYRPEVISLKPSIIQRIKAVLIQDYRSEASITAFNSIFEGLPEHALCLSIGGGPSRPNPLLVNVNIGPFVNVDVVADAHYLPYAENSVDAIYCEAVIEHLYNPIQAIKEMHRVLKPSGKAYVCTPFLQAYHGYPHHYQNYTLTGHKRLFEVEGFNIIEAGTCVGPTYTIVNLVSGYLSEYSPRLIRTTVCKVWGLFGAIIRPLDKVLNLKDNSYILASTTYLLASK
jgi:SAM-dependent methyltransferase